MPGISGPTTGRGRRTWLAAGIAAGIAAGLAVAVTVSAVWVVTGGTDPIRASRGTGSTRADGGSGAYLDPPVIPPGWRWESYLGAEVQLPSAWTYGVSNAPWCLDRKGRGDGQQDGEVGRPGPVPAIGCMDPVPSAKRGQHVWFNPAGSGLDQPGTQHLGDRWVRDVIVVGPARLEVQTRDPAVRARILGSVRQVRYDAGRCPVEHRISSAELLRPGRGVGWDAKVTGLSICRYGDVPGPGPTLIASRRLDGAAAQQVLDAIRAAPAGGGPDDPAGGTMPVVGGVVLRFDTADGVREVFVRSEGSRHNGFDNGAERRRLTRESLTFMTAPFAPAAGPMVTMSLLPGR